MILSVFSREFRQLSMICIAKHVVICEGSPRSGKSLSSGGLLTSEMPEILGLSRSFELARSSEMPRYPICRYSTNISQSPVRT